MRKKGCCRREPGSFGCKAGLLLLLVISGDSGCRMSWNAAMLTYGYRYVIRYPSEPKARQKRVLPSEPGWHEELSNAGRQTENRQADPDRSAESGHVKQESYP